ncbi:MAG: hypothetical protein KIT83_18170, partial [Bryobacterales bacterium]|nr:hypothetical protein [Bryobacterales bacterium]
MRVSVLRIALLALLIAVALQAKVDHVEVSWSGTVLNGKAFGSAGAYEALRGTIHFVVDPDDHANDQIVDI